MCHTWVLPNSLLPFFHAIFFRSSALFGSLEIVPFTTSMTSFSSKHISMWYFHTVNLSPSNTFRDSKSHLSIIDSTRDTNAKLLRSRWPHNLMQIGSNVTSNCEETTLLAQWNLISILSFTLTQYLTESSLLLLLHPLQYLITKLAVSNKRLFL